MLICYTDLSFNAELSPGVGGGESCCFDKLDSKQWSQENQSGRHAGHVHFCILKFKGFL